MNKVFLPGIFFAGTVVLLFVYSQGTLNKRNTATASKGKVSYGKVHLYKQETAMKIGIEKDQAQFRKETQKDHLEISDRSHLDFSETGLTPEKNIGQDMRGESYTQAVTLDQKMDNFLAQRQKFEEEEFVKKKAYVDEFKREALKMGFVVIIDDDMQIVSVKKKKKK